MKKYRGKYGKITDDIKKEMKEMASNGVLQKDIATKFGVSQATVSYHLDPRSKEKVKRRSSKARDLHGSGSKRYPERTRAYIREYMKDRRHNDEEFRQRTNEHIRKNQQKSIKSDSKRIRVCHFEDKECYEPCHLRMACEMGKAGKVTPRHHCYKDTVVKHRKRIK